MPEIVKMAIGILSKEIRSKLITCLRNSFDYKNDKITGCDADSFKTLFNRSMAINRSLVYLLLQFRILIMPLVSIIVSQTRNMNIIPCGLSSIEHNSVDDLCEHFSTNIA